VACKKWAEMTILCDHLCTTSDQGPSKSASLERGVPILAKGSNATGDHSQEGKSETSSVGDMQHQHDGSG
jgi:hypothetical protein